MALDRQKILNELGNVVNQLQSADCGCMGKLFSNPNEANPNTQHGSYGGSMQSCCHHGHRGFNSPSAGEPCCGGRHCMGACNAPKLYADTYNYLNQNMMQPVVREVYEDLKSISPANAVMNSPLATQMGLPQGSNPNQGNMMTQNGMLGRPAGNEHSMMPNGNPSHTPHLYFGNPDMNPNVNTMQMNNAQDGMGQMGQGYEMHQGPGQNDYTMGQMNQGMNQKDLNMGQNMGQMRQETGGGRMMAGMGPDILNMMKSSARQHQNSPPMNADDNIPQTQMSQMPSGNVYQGHFQPDNIQNNHDMNKMQWNPNTLNTQYSMSQPQRFPEGAMNTQNNGISGNMTQMYFEQEANNDINASNTNNPQSQMRNTGAVPLGINNSSRQMGNINSGQMNYGKHNAGMAKFNEMFPGVINGDLGFDPMAIAIQMNPANQQKSAIETMEKMMMGKTGAGLNQVMNSTGKATTLMQGSEDSKNATSTGQFQLNQQQMNEALNQQNAMPAQQPTQQQQPQEVIVEGVSNKQPQQVYTALTTPSQQQQQYQLLQQIPSDQTPQPQQEMLPQKARETEKKQLYKEPIFPADNSRNLLHSHHFAKPQSFYEYNTLGQLVDLQPAKLYHTPEPSLPQTLSPQPKRHIFSNVKNTISKTSIMGNQPVRGTSSRNQLQHIYNQYKGSQSFTQQNIKPIQQNVSHSTGHIKVPGTVTPMTPIERTGGDTVGNTVNNEYIPTKLEPIKDQVGDAPAAEKLPIDNVKPTAKNAKLRNGLQDQVFTTYPGSAKWSFHGHGHATPAPFSVGYRFRQK